jgi:hypothetical protein
MEREEEITKHNVTKKRTSFVAVVIEEKHFAGEIFCSKDHFGA